MALTVTSALRCATSPKHDRAVAAARLARSFGVAAPALHERAANWRYAQIPVENSQILGMTGQL